MMIIKIGGGAAINLNGIVTDLKGLSEPFIIVHGANALRDELAAALGREKRVITSVSGYSSVFSDESALDVMMMAYSGLRNKRLVELCQQNGINAIGLSGLDGRLIRGRRNKGIRVKENGKFLILRDFSGKPQSINSDLINLLLENGYVPVLTVPILDERNIAINSENDDIIAVMQATLKADKIIQFIEAPGYLKDPDDAQSVLANITQQELLSWEEQSKGRMKRKIHALRKLFEAAPTRVIIADGRTEHPLLDALNGSGTVVE